MKLTKQERKERRRRILKGIGSVVTGVAVDMVPGGERIGKGIEKVIDGKPQIPDSSPLMDYIPLARTITGIVMEIVGIVEDIIDLIKKARD